MDNLLTEIPPMPVPSPSDTPPKPNCQHSNIALADLQSLLHWDDKYYESLSALFEQLQLAAYEASDMMLGFIAFVNSVQYFAVIVREEFKTDTYRSGSFTSMLLLPHARSTQTEMH